jgi:hypothetical protein
MERLNEKIAELIEICILFEFLKWGECQISNVNISDRCRSSSGSWAWELSIFPRRRHLEFSFFVS